jgi:hypothetical protein
VLPDKVIPWPAGKVITSADTPLKVVLPRKVTVPEFDNTERRITFCDALIVIELELKVFDQTLVDPIIFYFKKLFKLFLYSNGIVV